MWTFKYRPNKKVVEGRAKYAGADLLLTVSRDHTRLAMNGGVLIRHGLFDALVHELSEAAKQAREILKEESDAS